MNATVTMKPNGCVYDGVQLLGRVYRIQLSERFAASRKRGESGVDIRRASRGFKTTEAAAAWIARGDR